MRHIGPIILTQWETLGDATANCQHHKTCNPLRTSHTQLLATLLLTVALMYSPALRPQDESLIKPGDILIVKLLPPDGGQISKVMAVTSGGTMTPPPLLGIRQGESISVDGLRLDEATRRVEQRYRLFPRKFKARSLGGRYRTWDGS
jgi:hypothetical protein